jgi:hypothetical protein
VAEPTIRVDVEGAPPGVAERILPRLRRAVDAVGLGGGLAGVVLRLDDLPGGGEAWYGREDSAGGSRLVVYCHPESLERRSSGGRGGGPAREVWEQAPAPAHEEFFDPESAHPERTDAFQHHHLATAGDVLAGRVVGEEIPRALAEAFTACWAVTVDGRLARAGLPGFDLPERRRRFSRLFSAAGILMPDHWQIFQALWDGALADQRDVLAVIRQLPRL